MASVFNCHSNYHHKSEKKNSMVSLQRIEVEAQTKGKISEKILVRNVVFEEQLSSGTFQLRFLKTYLINLCLEMFVNTESNE